MKHLRYFKEKYVDDKDVESIYLGFVKNIPITLVFS